MNANANDDELDYRVRYRTGFLGNTLPTLGNAKSSLENKRQLQGVKAWHEKSYLQTTKKTKPEAQKESTAQSSTPQSILEQGLEELKQKLKK